MSKFIVHINKKPFLAIDDTFTPLDTSKVYEVVEKRLDTRTVLANRAMHLYCKHVAKALNNRDLSVTAILKPEIKFTMITVKEQLFKPILSALRGKESTTQMTSNEITSVYDVMNKVLSEKFGISVDFPSQESLNFQQNYKDK